LAPNAPETIDDARDISSPARNASTPVIPPCVASEPGTTRAWVSNRLIAESSRSL
jgi:hypothetical protein